MPIFAPLKPLDWFAYPPAWILPFTPPRKSRGYRFSPNIAGNNRPIRTSMTAEVTHPMPSVDSET
ncbi:hypothetical protein QF001_004543 [Paraburkholderia youngii]